MTEAEREYDVSDGGINSGPIHIEANRPCIHCGVVLRQAAIRCTICSSKEPFKVKAGRRSRRLMNVLIMGLMLIIVYMFRSVAILKDVPELL
ncbi:hypothetical protein J2785_007249 [Burkholderia ambifaria]|nr:hypothetical protein [Burkholderia ambifaria]MDR6504055.1 hypothetical protein [Burkholderia ambifaria]